MAAVGIMGGTFDPIHLAHLSMARCAMEQYALDKVLFMPSKLPPHKKSKGISDEMHRCNMVKLAVEEEEGFYFSDFECRRDRTTYTAETLQLLQEAFPKDCFYFIMGGDSLFQMEQWFLPEEILRRAVILAVGRDGASNLQMQQKAKELCSRFGGSIQLVTMPQMQISSSMIRQKIRAGESVQQYLPGAVWNYIEQTHCY